MPVSKSIATKKSKAEISKLQVLKKSLSKDLNKCKHTASKKAIASLKQQIGRINAKIEKLNRNISSAATPSSQLTKRAVSAKKTSKGKGAGNKSTAADALINAALKKLQKTKKYSLVNVSVKRSIPVYAGVNAVVALSSKVNVTAAVKPQKSSLLIQGKIDGSLTPSIALGIGIDLSPLGNYSISGGIQGNAAVNASSKIMLDVHKKNIRAVVDPFNMKVSMGASLFLEFPGQVVKVIKGIDSSIKFKGNKLMYPIGKVDILTVTTPRYTLTFSPAKGKFSYVSKSGKTTVTVNKKVKTTVKEITSTVEKAVDKAMDAINPVSGAKGVFKKVKSWF